MQKGLDIISQCDISAFLFPSCGTRAGPSLWRTRRVCPWIKAALVAHTRRSVDVASAQRAGAPNPHDQPPEADSVGETDNQFDKVPDRHRFSLPAVRCLAGGHRRCRQRPPGISIGFAGTIFRATVAVKRFYGGSYIYITGRSRPDPCWRVVQRALRIKAHFPSDEDQTKDNSRRPVRP
jgi:hypothetical protein